MGTDNSGDLNLALRITSDVNSGVAGVNQVGNSVEQLEAKTKAASAALAQQRTAFDALAAKIDPVGAKLDELANLQIKLEQAAAIKGVVPAGAFDALTTTLDKRRSALEAAAEGATHLSLASAGAAREYGVLAGELARGNTARLEGSLFTLANRVGVLPLLFSGAGAAILGATAIVGAFGFAAVKGAEEDDKLNTALLTTGNYAGATLGQIHLMAQGMEGSVGSIGDARQALQALVASGRFTEDQIKAIAPAVVDMAKTSGQSIDKVVEEFIRLQDDPVKAAEKLNETYHFLTAATFDQAKALEEQGNRQGAADVLMKAFADTVEQRTPDAVANAGLIERAFRGIKKAISESIDAAKDIGREQTPDETVKALEQLKANAGKSYDTATPYGVVTHQYVAWTAEDQAALDKATHDRDVAIQKAAAQSQQDQANANHMVGIKTLDEETKKYRTAAEKYADEVKSINAATKLALQGTGVDAKAVNAQAATNLQRAKEAFDRQNEKKGASIDRAELSTATEQARQDLQRYADAFTNAERVIDASHKAGTVSDQDYYAAKKKDIDDLEQHQVAALEAEKAAVSVHGTTAAERIRINQQVEGINQQIDKARADAASKRAALDEQQHAADLRKLEDASKLQEAYNQATGRPSDAAGAKAAREFAPQLAAAKLTGDQQTIDKVQVVVDTAAAKAQVEQLKTLIDSTLSDQQRQEQDIQSQLQAGLISQVDAQKQLVDLHARTYATLSSEVPKVQAIAATSLNPQIIRTSADLTEQLKLLGNQVDQVTAQVDTTFQGAFENVFDGIGTRITSVRQLFNTLILDVASGLQKIVAQDLAKEATTSISGITSSISRLLGGTGTTVAQSATSVATGTTATAISTSGTEAATSITAASTNMATAIVTAGNTAAGAIAAAASGGGSGTGINSLLPAGAKMGSTDLGSTGGFWDAITSLFGGGYGSQGAYDTGGYTGDMATHKIAGVVHGQEHVTRAAVVAQPGARALLDDLNTYGMAAMPRHVPGYADGGFVGPPAPNRPVFPFVSNGSNAHSRAPLNLHVINVPHHSLVKDYLDSRAGSEHVLNIIDNNPTACVAHWVARNGHPESVCG